MKKILKQWGNSLVIVFNSEETKIYSLNKGDLIDIELVKIKKLPCEKDNKKLLNKIKEEVSGRDTQHS